MSNKKNVEELLNKLENMNFWQRLFSWTKIANLIGKSKVELESLDKELETISNTKEELIKDKSNLTKDLEHTKEKYNSQIQEKVKQEAKLEAKLQSLENEKKSIENEKVSKEKELLKYRSDYEEKVKKLDSAIDYHNKEIEKINNDKVRELDEKHKMQEKTWQEHESNVEAIIKNICKRNNIVYFDKNKVPIDKKPDNTIQIADEYVVLDAKSPGNIEKLDNFSTYIKTQVNSLKKYIDQDNVLKTAYLVVPFDTIKVLQDKLKDLVIQTDNYKVFIVTPDSLESIILSLKKIEEYDFVDKLSPQDRDNIAEIIGQFAHSAKRRIEVDNYLNEHTINVLEKCHQLPDDIKNKSQSFEKSSKVNPPMDKLDKMIKTEELDKSIKKVETKKRLLEPFFK